MVNWSGAKVGFTTSIPVEVIFAAGAVPVDINNIFITHPRCRELVEEAEFAGFPRNVCSWIKGIYSTVIEAKDIQYVIAVTQGDCSFTHALMEIFECRGIKTIPFAYPYGRDYDLLKLQIEKLMDFFGVGWEEIYGWKEKLDAVRRRVHYLDELTWRHDRVRGFINHLYQVSCSDFNGDPSAFAMEVEEVMAAAEKTAPAPGFLRLGYIGVPPICPDLYDYLETIGARVVFNEVQRQFSMPFSTSDLVEKYRQYTYPYDVFARIKDIQEQARLRRLDGIIHYAQTFCFRQMQDLILRERIKLPILTLEGDKPGKLDARSRMRVDSFVQMLKK
ncbi:MAG: 2-hydroxyacyl-CoA dehydratase family protein [Bacillota bacterium]